MVHQIFVITLLNFRNDHGIMQETKQSHQKAFADYSNMAQISSSRKQ